MVDALLGMFKNRSEFFANTKLQNNASLERMKIKVCVASVLKVRIPLTFIGNRNLLRNPLHKLGIEGEENEENLKQLMDGLRAD